MDYSKESLDRKEKIKKLKEAGVIVYANNYRGKQDISFVQNKKESVKELEILLSQGIQGDFQLAGRLMSSKSHGKLIFSKIMDNTGILQICFMKDEVLLNSGVPGTMGLKNLLIEGEEKDAYKIAEKFLNIGDYIGVKGDLFFTKHGELTLLVKEFQILAKAVRPLPEKFHGINDQETIYRQRYLDLIMNDASYQRFLLRSKFVQALRKFYLKNNFIEIETPILWNSASGAAAKPFITHHNDFWEDFFLRIAPETALKKATVGRFERVFEIGRNFRNEGSDPSHMQEFSVVEHYASWWNFEDNMKFTEELFDHLFSSLQLSKIVPIKDKEGNLKEVDFTTPWKRIDYIRWVEESSGINVENYTMKDEEKLREDIQKAGYTWVGIEKQGLTTMIDYLYKKVLRPTIVGPAFIYNYPKTMQPLARQSDSDENIVEQFQVLVNGWEILKAYSELVDPEIQKSNFDAQGQALLKWDEEATSGDDEFLLAMEYGMPPQSWLGMGLDRIFSLLTEQENLRDVVLFPLMRGENKGEVKAKKTMLAVSIINKWIWLEPWQEMNTIAHLNAAFWAREGRSLFTQNTVATKDNTEINLNIQHAIMIKESPNSAKIITLIKKAQAEWLQIAEFTREMLNTTDDKNVVEWTKQKDFQEVEYLWVEIFWPKKIVEALTNEFPLYQATNNKINDGKDQKEELVKKEEKSDYENLSLPSIEQAQALVEKYAPQTKQHLISVWFAMKYFAKKLWQNEQAWQLVGLLHDIDWDYIEKDWNRHCKEDLEKIVSEIGLPKELIDDIKSHGYWLTNVNPDTLIRKYICSLDELTGFITAVGKMMPNKKIEEIKLSSVLKKIKDKSFAAWVSREELRNCEKMLGQDLEIFTQELLEGLSQYASEFGM
jgi:lysyl-tRNA synthetase, class II